MAVTQTLSVTEVSGSIDNVANTSKVRILWKSTQTGESWNGYTRTAKYYVSINGGAETEYSVSYTLPQSSTVTIVDTTITVTHKSDGSGTVVVRTWMDTSISAEVVEKVDTLTLTPIPRASILNSLSCATKYFNGKLTYKYTPKNSNFYTRCNISLNINGTYTGIRSVLLGKQSTSQKTESVTFDKDELSVIYNKLTNTPKGVLRFTLRTYSDSGYVTQIGDTIYKEITLYIPEDSSTKPSATMILSPVTSLKSPFDTLYIKGRSKVAASFTNEKGEYGASIVSREISVGGKTYGSPCTSGYLSTVESVDVIGTVTDSRGFSNTYTQKITVLPYEKPKILPASNEKSIICARCDENGDLSESGTNLKIKATRSYYKVESDDVQKNFCIIRYRVREESQKNYSDWVTILDNTATIDEIDIKIEDIALSAEKDYFVQVGVIDDMGEDDAVQFPIPADFVTVDIPEELKGRRIGLLRYARKTSKAGIDVGAPIYGGSVDSLMLGEILSATEALPINLDDIKTPGCYYSPSASYSQYILNSPYTDGGFGLEVRELQSENYIRQTLYYGRTTLVRHWNTSSWSEWVRYLTVSETESVATDFVIESGEKNGWIYKKWKSGTFEMFGRFTVKATVAGTEYGSMYYSEQFVLPAPFACSYAVVTGTATSWFIPITGGLANNDDPNNNIGIRLFRPTAFAVGQESNVKLYVTGEYM